ncbi:MAG: hypothetical protein OER88_01215 [Planctomycetota bacterium]|nr:hypothetical protein [Planctomycetota bacterium]
MQRLCWVLVLSAWAHADTVVLRDRTVLEGAVAKSEKALTVAGKTVPLADVLAWEDGDTVAQYAASFRDHYDACLILADRERLRICLERLPKATNKAAAWELLATAAECGLDPKAEKAWQKKIAQLGTGAGTAAAPGAEVLANIFTTRAVAASDADQEMRARRLLRAALDTGVENEDATDLLDDMAPDSWRVGNPYQPRIWLDWHIDVIQPGMRAVGRNQPDVQRARGMWLSPERKRQKLWGAQTQEITFVTKLSNSSIVSMCTKYAWLTCRSLDEMFRTDTPKRDDNLPLVIYFFENRAEYLRVNSGRGPMLAMSAGFYSSNDMTSRFFWVDGRVRSVRNTFVHELTHHWVDRRNPRLDPKDLAGGGERFMMPGFWIVEGFATFIEEGSYDIRAAKWSHFNAAANSIDIVSDLARQGKNIDWTKLYTLTQQDFNNPEKLEPKKLHARAIKKWSMRPQPLNEVRLFYEQSAATSHFLYWADEGKYRQQLLDYVTHYYTGETDKVSIEAGFGMKPAELGQRVEAFCKRVRNGWKPPRR